MLYGQNWQIWYEFAHDQHQAKIQAAARYRLIKQLQRLTAKSARRQSRPHWWLPRQHRMSGKLRTVGG